MIISCVFINLGGMTDWLFSGVQGKLSRIILWVGSEIFYIASACIMLSYVGYIVSFLENKGVKTNKVLILLGKILSLITIVTALLSIFTGIVFTITEDNVYQRGSLYIYSQLSTYFIYVISFILLLGNRKHFTIKEKVFFYSFSFIPLIAQIIQAFNYGIALFSTSLTVSLFLVFICIHSELKKEIQIKEMSIKRAEYQHMEYVQHKQKVLIEQAILALSNTVEAKDFYTNGHAQRVAKYTREIAKRLGFSEEEQLTAYYVGLLHDVGKIRVSDSIINKTTKLTKAEYEEMCLHTSAGYYILKVVSEVPELAIGARWHHERYDGKGYPNGLSGENIPLIARIIAVADAYDAMTSNRSYRNILTQDKVESEIRNGLGTQFDPTIGSIMLEMIAEDRYFEMKEPKAAEKYILLAIDDDPMVLKLLEFILVNKGNYELITATSGKEGLELLKNNYVDLVLLDVEMPQMNGFEVLENIRKTNHEIPVIFMTGEKDMAIIQKAEASGINDYITKPLISNMLNESIHNVIHSSAYKRK